MGETKKETSRDVRGSSKVSKPLTINEIRIAKGLNPIPDGNEKLVIKE